MADAVWRLYAGLWVIRSQSQKPAWKAMIQVCREHPLFTMMPEDPFIARAYRKPRGYAGDAGIIDYLYRISPTTEEMAELTPLGQAILQVTTAMPSAFAVRERKRLAACEIDRIAECSTRPTILAMAAGHAREVASSAAVSLRKVGRFLAFDQDERSINVIRTEYGGFGIECLPVSVQDLLQGHRPVQNVDLIYALGLYDYLTGMVAQRLTAALFEMLAPGGNLLLANFLPDVFEAGVMEAFMDWFLIYRTPEQLDEVAGNLRTDEISLRDVWTDDGQCVAYLRLAKR